MVPPRVRIVSIRPDINPQNQLEINLEAIGDSRDKAIDLVRHMEESPSFREAQVRSERVDAQSQGVAFTIVALYNPRAVRKGGQ